MTHRFTCGVCGETYDDRDSNADDHGACMTREELVEEIARLRVIEEDWQHATGILGAKDGESAEMAAQHLSHEEAEAKREVARLTAIINTPELAEFSTGVAIETVHQRERWGSEHDDGKAPSDWLWLLGFLAGKALAAHIAGDVEKALHHTISSAAVLANWHAAIAKTHTGMRPGIKEPA